jgi:hypothetical protein
MGRLPQPEQLPPSFHAHYGAKHEPKMSRQAPTDEREREREKKKQKKFAERIRSTVKSRRKIK